MQNNLTSNKEINIHYTGSQKFKMVCIFGPTCTLWFKIETLLHYAFATSCER